MRRELAVWKLAGDNWKLVSTSKVPGVEDPNLMVGFPELSRVTPNGDGVDILLTYRDGSVITCQYKSEKIACADKKRGPSSASR